MSWSLDRCSGDRHRAVAVDAHDVGCAVRPAQHARRTETAVVHHEGGARVAAQQLHLVVHAEAAAPLTGAARSLAQREAVVEHGEVLLHHLHRRGLGDADGGAAVAEPVVVGVAAVAAARRSGTSRSRYPSPDRSRRARNCPTSRPAPPSPCRGSPARARGTPPPRSAARPPRRSPTPASGSAHRGTSPPAA